MKYEKDERGAVELVMEAVCCTLGCGQFLPSEVPPPLDFSFRQWFCLENSRNTFEPVAVFQEQGKAKP